MSEKIPEQRISTITTYKLYPSSYGTKPIVSRDIGLKPKGGRDITGVLLKGGAEHAEESIQQEQIIGIFREADTGSAIKAICAAHTISRATYHAWARLKRLVAHPPRRRRSSLAALIERRVP